ncbi:hypothetical protein PC116_g25412 [Phytophthora cactorum]|nr:hypothetical protein Pcac1_g9584 [Phytophthora cactorum]KAG4226177.1 hypothetical protein PC116_g25412 [Phytophthora cactorum]
MRTHPVFYVGLLKPFQDSAQVGVEALAPGQQETAEPQAAGRQRVAEPQDVERTAEGAATDQADPAAEQPDAQGRRPGSEGHSVPQTSPPDGASLRDLLLSGRVKRSRHERRNSASEYADLAQSRRGDSQREGPGEADTACVGRFLAFNKTSALDICIFLLKVLALSHSVAHLAQDAQSQRDKVIDLLADRNRADIS